MAWMKRHFPMIVSIFIATTGCFFLANALLETALIGADLRAKAPVAGIGLLFVAAGGLFVYLACKGRLERNGPSVTEVRTAAVSNMTSPSTLRDIAANDPSSRVSRAAASRLKEIAGQ
jgi:hypothetical protein